MPGPEFDVAQTFISYLRSCNQVITQTIGYIYKELQLERTLAFQKQEDITRMKIYSMK